MSYWSEREQENLRVEQRKDAEVIEEMRVIIEDTMLEVERDIDAFYGRYAEAEGITRAEARKQADTMDVAKFERTAARYVKERTFSKRANRELRLYNLKMRTSREQILKAQLNVHLVAMANKTAARLGEYMESAMMRELTRQAGILGRGVYISQEAITAIVNTSFKGAVWSTRIWNDMAALRSRLFKTINNAILRGVHPYRDVRKYKEQFGVTTREAKRLLITETARVQMEAQRLSYEKNEVLQYEYVAVLDDRTTVTCEKLDGEIFDVKDMMPGVNAPPMHPHCRSSTVPSLGDWRTQFFKERADRYGF